MSTKANSEPLEIPEAPAGMTAAVVTAKWNSHITHALRDGALRVLEASGVAPNRIVNVDVPGTIELVNAAAGFVRNELVDTVIVIGCVIRGDTPHFDYVCQAATQGVAILNAEGKGSVIFGVLTVENEQQALDRAGGILGNKGEEAALAAIRMVEVHNATLAMKYCPGYPTIDGVPFGAPLDDVDDIFSDPDTPSDDQQ